MLVVVMSIKQQVSRVQFNYYAPNRPHVTDLVPFTALKQDLGWAVLAGIDYWAVVFVVFCCRSEIYYFEVCVLWVKVLLHSSVVFANLKIIPLKQYIFGLQVCMSVSNAVDKTQGS